MTVRAFGSGTLSVVRPTAQGYRIASLSYSVHMLPHPVPQVQSFSSGTMSRVSPTAGLSMGSTPPTTGQLWPRGGK